MDPGPGDLRLPPRDVIEPKIAPTSVIRIVVQAFVVTFALVFVIDFPIDRHSSAANGAIVALGLVVFILAVELPLHFRAHDRRRQALMAGLPAGGFYAGRASLLAHDGKRGLPVTGTILFTGTGMTFTPTKRATPPLNLPWDDVRRIRLAPAPGKIGVSRLVLMLTDGRTRAFAVPRYRTMARTFAQQP